MGKARTLMSCSACGQQVGQWVGRCPGCGAWGTVEQRSPGAASRPVTLQTLQHEAGGEARASTGIPGFDRVLGGGLVPATVALLAGEPGIGKASVCARRMLQQPAGPLQMWGAVRIAAGGIPSRSLAGSAVGCRLTPSHATA